MAAKKKPAKKKPIRAALKKLVKKKASPIPKGYHSVTPFLTVDDAKRALDWYTKAFGAKELSRMEGPDGKVMHAEIRIGDGIVMLADEMPGMSKSAKAMGGSPAGVMIYTKNVDDAFKKAEAAGAKVLMPVADQFWGDRYGQLEDPFGYRWSFGTRIKDLTPKQMKQAMDEWMAQMMAGGGAPPQQQAS